MTAPRPTPRKTTRAAASRAPRRRWLQYVLLFVTVALIVNALIGERGLTAYVKAQRDVRETAATLEEMKRRNEELRQEVVSLKTDPAAIEEAARRDLGLARDDELLFIVKDVPSKPAPARQVQATGAAQPARD